MIHKATGVSRDCPEKMDMLGGGRTKCKAENLQFIRMMNTPRQPVPTGAGVEDELIANGMESLKSRREDGIL